MLGVKTVFRCYLEEEVSRVCEWRLGGGRVKVFAMKLFILIFVGWGRWRRRGRLGV